MSDNSPEFLKYVPSYSKLARENAAPAAAGDAVRADISREVVERECGQLFGPLFEPTKRLLRELRRQLDVIDRLSKCGSADSFMQLSDEEKRKWFAMYVSTDADLHAEIRALRAALANQPQSAGAGDGVEGEGV